jgi:hypothetical protein
MSSSILRRLIIVLTLGAFLGSPAISLAGPHSTARFSEERTADLPLLSRLWNAVVRAWEKEGCTIDPYGRCVNVPLDSGDAGCMIDPNGRCLQKSDNGCSIDPFGRCIPGH